MKERTFEEFLELERHTPLAAFSAVRLPKRLSMFVKTHALIKNSSESAVIRFALEQWATKEGYDRAGA